MEAYAKKVRKRIRIISICMVMIACVITYNVFFVDPSLKSDNIFEFQVGLLVGLSILGGIYITKMNRALANEQQLRIAFNNENDERKKMIYQKSGLPVILYTSLAMLLGGVIAGYFNIIIFYSLVAAAICQLLIAGMLKIFYLKRM